MLPSNVFSNDLRYLMDYIIHFGQQMFVWFDMNTELDMTTESIFFLP